MLIEKKKLIVKELKLLVNKGFEPYSNYKIEGYWSSYNRKIKAFSLEIKTEKDLVTKKNYMKS